MAKLKVFSWSNGFHRFTVATTSRPKALAAWGLSQDIFKTGLAAEAPDSPDAPAALASPGEVVQRGEAVDVGEIARPSRRAKTKSRVKPPEPRGPSAADRERVATLERDLDALDAGHEAARADIEARRQALETEAASLRTTHRKARAELARKLDAARARL
ncbi:MAG: hypothetical protein KJ676_09760 [Alphaproteobacteria bacterium]|nr:hypothetical protein [Alphaproteobacteria bacterium]MBU1527493.1 hypothetical protein [Alphaproteobacteria bacterium]MBU2117843.1 hypothetical protein [Alphaproteobacteria bacterium]MBU2352637.1 hypothetical protein [Alphaproteobacteria bacterium]MBU2383012.1 hypothetical protein [Alphaproteobacteria bacterium]